MTEGSRKATCACTASSGRGSPLSPSLSEPAGNGRLLSGTKPEASAASQNIPGSLQHAHKYKRCYKTRPF